MSLYSFVSCFLNFAISSSYSKHCLIMILLIKHYLGITVSSTDLIERGGGGGGGVLANILGGDVPCKPYNLRPHF